MAKERVAILGASDNPERYSYKALKMLEEYQHLPFPVTPRLARLDGHDVAKKLSQLKNIDTVTVYVNPDILREQMTELLALKPRRVIFNPGTESREMAEQLEKAGIHTVEACTLVLLRTNQFESV